MRLGRSGRGGQGAVPRAPIRSRSPGRSGPASPFGSPLALLPHQTENNAETSQRRAFAHQDCRDWPGSPLDPARGIEIRGRFPANELGTRAAAGLAARTPEPRCFCGRISARERRRGGWPIAAREAPARVTAVARGNWVVRAALQCRRDAGDELVEHSMQRSADATPRTLRPENRAVSPCRGMGGCMWARRKLYARVYEYEYTRAPARRCGLRWAHVRKAYARAHRIRTHAKGQNADRVRRIRDAASHAAAARSGSRSLRPHFRPAQQQPGSVQGLARGPPPDWGRGAGPHWRARRAACTHGPRARSRGPPGGT